MKQFLIFICLALLPASGASALSCLKPEIERSFQQYSAAKETYILVRGELTNKRNVVAGEPRSNGRPGSESFIATFSGFQATRSGFDRPLNATIAVESACIDWWCELVEVDQPVIAFFEKTTFGYTLSEGVCGGAVFYNPDEEMIDKSLQCLRGGLCDPLFR